jgi:hypothetical protein
MLTAEAHELPRPRFPVIDYHNHLDALLLASCFGPLRRFVLAQAWDVEFKRVGFGSAGA